MVASSQLILDAARLSILSYEGTNYGNFVGDLDPTDLTPELKASGWSLVSRTELGLDGILSAGFFNGEYLYDSLGGQAFVAKNGNDYAMVFRGTQGAWDWYTDVRLDATLEVQYAQFAILITGAFKNLVESVSGATGYLFGHSLGGAMAEVFMTYNSESRYEAITFGSPGARTLGSVDSRVTNIEHSQDPVVYVPLGIDPTGDRIKIHLSDDIGAFSQHPSARYEETLKIIHDSGLFDSRGNREIVVGSNDVADSFSLGAKTEGFFILGGGGNDSLSGGFGGDLIHGGANNDTLRGNGGNDYLHGGSGTDKLYGGNAADRLYGEDGVDYLYGGDGNDTLYGGNEDDWLYGGAHSDTLKGEAHNDHLFGEDGEDTLYGDAGDDTLAGGDNNDTLDGGAGTGDVAVFEFAQSSYQPGNVVSESSFNVLDRTSYRGGIDTLTNIEFVQFAGGPKIAVADYLAGYLTPDVPPPPPPVEPPAPIVDDYGDTQAEATSFGASPISGYSSITGDIEVAGDQDMFKVSLVGGAKYAFILSASSGATNNFDPFLQLTSPNGSTVYNDNLGTGILSAFISFTAQQTGTYFLKASGSVSTTGEYFLVASKIATDNTAETLNPTSTPSDPSSPNYWHWQGTSDDDSFPTPSWDPYKGNLSAANNLRGHDGDDRIKAGGGNDVVWGDDDDDRLYGEAGNDVLKGGRGHDRLYGDTGRDELHGERGDDYLSGGDDADYLHGGDGDDRLRGGDGNDYLKGGDDDDDLNGGDGNDELYGDGGIDDLDGDAGNDLLFGGFGDDELRGGTGHDRLAGEDGEDLLKGESGDDLLYGGDDDDILIGGSGNDLLHGERGRDTADFSDGRDGVVVNLFDEIAVSDDLGRDILHSIENVNGSRGDDVIDGDHGRNILFGGDGDDLIRGHDGNDEIDGGEDDDILWGDTGIDIVWGGDGNDELRGGLGNDTLYGGNHDDELRGEQGDDTLDGGLGIDTALFWGERADFFATQVSAGLVQVLDIRAGGQEGTDTLQSIEFVKFFDATMAVGDLFVANATAVDDRVRTGAQKPILIDALANDLDFGASETTIVSVTLISGQGTVYIVDNKVVYNPDGAYDNLVDGDLEIVEVEYQMATSALFSDTGVITIEVTRTGDDIVNLVGSSGAELLEGQSLNDNLKGEGGSDALFGHGGDDTLSGGQGADWIDGGVGNDSLNGNAGDDSIFDPLGNDAINGGEGHDKIILLSGINAANGGIGNDLVIGGMQSDRLFGDAGDDVIRGDVGSGLFGGADVINGGADNDIMMGGVGADVFIFGINDGSDVIAAFDVADVVYDVTTGYSVNPVGTDFEVGIDHIRLEGFSTVNSTNVMSFVTGTGVGAVFSAEGTDITLYGVDAASLTTDVFEFI